MERPAPVTFDVTRSVSVGILFLRLFVVDEGVCQTADDGHFVVVEGVD